MKFKKILISSILGLGLMAGAVSAVAVACNNPSNGSNNQTNNQSNSNLVPENSAGIKVVDNKEYPTDAYSFRKHLTTKEVEKLENDTKEWFAKISKPLNELFPFSLTASNSEEILKNNPKLATTRDSGSLEQQDAAYAFGIAPDYAHFKWSNNIVVPQYLEKYYNPDKTKGLNMRNVTASTLTANNIGVLLSVEEAVSKYANSFINTKETSPVIAGIAAQSRSGGISSKRPAKILPNWIFGKEGENKDVNTYLKNASDSHAGFPNYFTDPYEGIILTGRMLDLIYDASKFDNVNKANIDGKTNFTSFEMFAKALSTKARNEFRKFVKSTNEWKDKDVLFVSVNPQAGGTPISNDFNENSDNLANLNNIFVVQPVYFPFLYASQDDAYTPGLGANFPAPTKEIEKIQGLVDDWGWIGGKAINDSEKEEGKKIGDLLGRGFEKRADKVVFTYNQYLIPGYDGTASTKHLVTEFEKKLTDYVNNLSDNSKFNATKMLKEKAVVGKNFFINQKDELYDASYGFLGLETIANTLNKWVKNSDSKVDLGISLFNKDTVQNIRAFKNSK